MIRKPVKKATKKRTSNPRKKKTSTSRKKNPQRIQKIIDHIDDLEFGEASRLAHRQRDIPDHTMSLIDRSVHLEDFPHRHRDQIKYDLKRVREDRLSRLRNPSVEDDEILSELERYVRHETRVVLKILVGRRSSGNLVGILDKKAGFYKLEGPEGCWFHFNAGDVHTIELNERQPPHIIVGKLSERFDD